MWHSYKQTFKLSRDRWETYIQRMEDWRDLGKLKKYVLWIETKAAGQGNLVSSIKWKKKILELLWKRNSGYSKQGLGPERDAMNIWGKANWEHFPYGNCIPRKFFLQSDYQSAWETTVVWNKSLSTGLSMWPMWKFETVPQNRTDICDERPIQLLYQKEKNSLIYNMLGKSNNIAPQEQDRAVFG